MKSDKSSLLDIIYAIEKIFLYTQNIGYEQFTNDEEKQDAVLRRIIIIGEAAKRISLEFRNSNSQVPWKEMAGMRDIVVHNYDQIKVQVIWDVLHEDLPRLLNQLKELVQ